MRLSISSALGNGREFEIDELGLGYGKLSPGMRDFKYHKIHIPKLSQDNTDARFQIVSLIVLFKMPMTNANGPRCKRSTRNEDLDATRCLLESLGIGNDDENLTPKK